MNLMADMFYGVVAAVCAIIIAIIIKRSKRDNKLDKNIKNLLTFFVLLCVVDAIWGFVNSHVLIKNYWVSTICIYLYYAFLALTTFVLFCYTFNYLGLSKNKIKLLYSVGALILIAQIVLIVLNYFKGDMFEINALTTIYQPYIKRYYIYDLQLVYDVIILIYILIKQISRKLDSDQKRIFKKAELYTIIFTITILVQKYLPNVCLCSVGLLMISFTIAPIDEGETTTEKEIIEDVKDKEILAEESEIKHASIVSSVSDSVKQVYCVNLNNLEYKVFNSQERKFEDDKNENNFYNLITNRLTEIINDDDRLNVFEKLDKDKINEALSNDNIYVVDYRIKDGDSFKAYSIRFMNVEDSDGKAIAYIQDEHKRIIKKVKKQPEPEKPMPRHMKKVD